MLKQAVKYYTEVTGRDWVSFYDSIGSSLKEQDPHGDMFVVNRLLKTLIAGGRGIDFIVANKDAVKDVFDEAGRRSNGEFFTPVMWAEEAHKYMDRYIPGWRTDWNVWENSCGTGNLIKTAGVAPGRLFASTLQQDDVDAIMRMPELEGCTAFQCDFLSGIDYDIYNTEFLDKLPPRLKEIIVNDEPLLIFCNPPYKVMSLYETEVGRYMKEIGLGTPAYDIFFQFCWRVMHFVEMFNLKNCYYAFFGPLQFFTGSSTDILMQEFRRSFDFIDGMCIPALEFSDTSDSIRWGVSFTIWKSRGGRQDEPSTKGVLLDRKIRLPDGSVSSTGKVLYELPKMKLGDWIMPSGVEFYESAPVMTSVCTFKGSEINEKIATMTMKIPKDALGTIMASNTLTRSYMYSAIYSTPTTLQHVAITEENFWRVVASFGFRRAAESDWSLTKKEFSMPNTDIEGYEEWVRNALVLIPFDTKSMMASHRGVKWNGYSNYVVRNKMFYLSEDEIRANCTDPVILADLDEYPLENGFMLEQLRQSEQYWWPEVRKLWDWCRDFTLFSFDRRKDVNYAGSLECADAGFAQLRVGGLVNDELFEDLVKVLAGARDRFRRDIWKFGFLSGIDDEV